jgi:hypothetical protein
MAAAAAADKAELLAVSNKLPPKMQQVMLSRKKQ